MRRFHVHVSVEDLDASIRFYAAVFGVPPSVRKPGCAKWMPVVGLTLMPPRGRAG